MGILTQAYFQIYLSELVEGIHYCLQLVITAFQMEVSTPHNYDSRVIHVSSPAYRQVYQLQFKTGGLHSSGPLLKGIWDHSLKPLLLG